MTRDLCDACWGSGDAEDVWTNWKEHERQETLRVQSNAADMLASRSGVAFRLLGIGHRHRRHPNSERPDPAGLVP